MGALEGQPILNAQDWEAVKRRGRGAIEKWIAEQMAYKTAVVVLVGRETAGRPWVRHEIAYAWDRKKPLVGVRINGLLDRSRKADVAGANPFTGVNLKGGGTVGDYVPLFEPTGFDSHAVYADIKKNLANWVERAYKRS
jgi:hypothetical protein